jgi:hypothetical protein
MTIEEARLDEASRRAAAHRARIKAGTAAIRARLAPARLVNDGKAHVQAQAKAVAADGHARIRAHPVATAAIFAGLLAWIFRKPLLKHAPPLAQRSYDWLAGKLPFSEIGAETESPNTYDDDVDDEVERDFDPEADLINNTPQ